MKRTNILSDEKDILKKTTHGNLKRIYKMQAKSCRNIFRVYHNQDNFLTELELREGVIVRGHSEASQNMLNYSRGDVLS